MFIIIYRLLNRWNNKDKYKLGLEKIIWKDKYKKLYKKQLYIKKWKFNIENKRNN